MRTLLSIAVLLSLTSPGFAQRGLSRGSASQQQALTDMQSDWNSAKKLSVGLRPTGGELPLQRDPDPSDVNENQVVDLDYWSFRVFSVVDPENMLLKCGPSIYWMSDYPTKGLADDDKVRLIGPVICIGTKQYSTVGGATSTVKAFRFVSAEEMRKQEKDREREAREREEAMERAFWGTWHSKAGTTIEAKFIAWRAGKVELLTKDGRKLVVDIGAFTDEDAERLRELNRQARAKKK